MDTILTWTISFPLGIQAAIKRGGWYDRITTFFCYFLISIPGFFFVYVLLIIIVVNQLHVPVIGMETFGLHASLKLQWLMDCVGHMLLPSVLGALAGIAVLSRYVRNQMLPFVTMFGLVIPGLIGGSVIIETIFSWPGIGRMAYQSILARDYPVILTLNFISALLVLIGTFISDVLYVLVDPRIKL